MTKINFAFEQMRSGAIRSFVQCNGRKTVDENAFVTAMFLREIRISKIDVPSSIIDSSIEFLLRCESKRKPATFVFWPENAHPRWLAKQRLPSDSDDTALVALELFAWKRWTAEMAIKSLVQMKLFRVPCDEQAQNSWHRAGAHFTWLTNSTLNNSIDLIVNINVLALICAVAPSDASKQTLIEMIKSAIERLDRCAMNLRGFSDYYSDTYDLAIALRNAILHGADDLNPTLKDLLVKLPKSPEVGWINKPLFKSKDGRMQWICSSLQAIRMNNWNSWNCLPQHAMEAKAIC